MFFLQLEAFNRPCHYCAEHLPGCATWWQFRGTCIFSSFFVVARQARHTPWMFSTQLSNLLDVFSRRSLGPVWQICSAAHFGTKLLRRFGALRAFHRLAAATLELWATCPLIVEADRTYSFWNWKHLTYILDLARHTWYKFRSVTVPFCFLMPKPFQAANRKDLYLYIFVWIIEF